MNGEGSPGKQASSSSQRAKIKKEESKKRHCNENAGRSRGENPKKKRESRIMNSTGNSRWSSRKVGPKKDKKGKENEKRRKGEGKWKRGGETSRVVETLQHQRSTWRRGKKESPLKATGRTEIVGERKETVKRG